MKERDRGELTHRLIPGGAHTYSKGDDQFPNNAPRHLERGQGAYVWDEHDNRFVDWTMGLRTMTLGYGYPGVNEAAIAQLVQGNNFGRPSLVETAAARDLVDLIPSIEMVKFAKNGSNVTTAAIKLARAFTGRDKVLFCKDHPFFSFDDWFIGTTACPRGVPKQTRSLSVGFRYNDLGSVERAFAAHRGEIACLIMEAATTEEPRDGFLMEVQRLCRQHNVVFIIDEMITGFRWHLQGAQTYFGIEPDLTTFGKGIANGFSVAVLGGRREIMQLGGLDHDQERVFLLSTTHGAENVGLAAMRQALKIYRTEAVVEHLWRVGSQVIDGLNEAAQDVGLGEVFKAHGFPCSPTATYLDGQGNPSLAHRTLFLQEMVRHGVLVSYFAPSFSHGDREIELTLDAARKAFIVVARALDDGWEGFLEGPVVKPVFRLYN